MEVVILWTQPVSRAVELARLAFRAGVQTGDLSFACYSCNHIITDLLAQGVHLDEVWSESQKGLEFDRKIKFYDAADIIVGQQRFIQNLRGQTVSFSSFSDSEFDEGAFEAQLAEDRMTSMVCYYWILKLEARYLSGDYDASLLAAQRAKALLWSAGIHFQSVNYYYYSGLTVAAVQETTSADSRVDDLQLVEQSMARLREWADNCPETFLHKYTLIAAEVARIEDRDLEAMRLYEQAIRLGGLSRCCLEANLGSRLRPAAARSAPSARAMFRSRLPRITAGWLCIALKADSRGTRFLQYLKITKDTKTGVDVVSKMWIGLRNGFCPGGTT